MSRLHSKRGPMHEINVVPYVDVMLVLLVIFMVTAPLEVVIREDQSLLLRARDAKGAVGEERKVALGELAALIRERQAKNPDQPVLIAGDKSVRYEAVLAVMDELQKQQVKRVGLLVKPAAR